MRLQVIVDHGLDPTKGVLVAVRGNTEPHFDLRGDCRHINVYHGVVGVPFSLKLVAAGERPHLVQVFCAAISHIPEWESKSVSCHVLNCQYAFNGIQITLKIKFWFVKYSLFPLSFIFNFLEIFFLPRGFVNIF